MSDHRTHYMWNEQKGEKLDPVAQRKLEYLIKDHEAETRGGKLDNIVAFLNGSLQETRALPQGLQEKDSDANVSGLHYGESDKELKHWIHADVSGRFVDVIIGRDDWNADIFVHGALVIQDHFHSSRELLSAIQQLP